MSDWISNDGSFGTDMSGAPEEVRTLTANKQFASVGDMAKAYSNLESMKGDFNNPESMKLPDQFTDEQMGTIKSRLGVPESADKYAINYEGDLQFDEGFINQFKEASFASGKTQAQIDSDIDFYAKLTGEQTTNYETELASSYENATKQLGDDWGESYDGNVEKVDKFVQDLGLSEVFADLGLSNNPSLIKAMHDLAGKTDESALPGNKEANAVSSKQRIEELMKSDAMNNRMHPDHDSAHKQVLQLIRENRK